jgi:hypothetical protein
MNEVKKEEIPAALDNYLEKGEGNNRNQLGKLF